MPGPGGPRGPRGPRPGAGINSFVNYGLRRPSYFGGYERSRRDGILNQTLIERFTEKQENKFSDNVRMKVRHGGLKGRIVAFRGRTLGGLRAENCYAKCARAAKDLEKGKITKNVFIKRCLNAHKAYAAYLYKIEYFNEREYYEYMKKQCEELGVEYEYAPEGRSR